MPRKPFLAVPAHWGAAPRATAAGRPGRHLLQQDAGDVGLQPRDVKEEPGEAVPGKGVLEARRPTGLQQPLQLRWVGDRLLLKDLKGSPSRGESQPFC